MKILYVTTVGSTMGFFQSFIKELLDTGHTVDIASNVEAAEVQGCYYDWGCKVYPISTSRSPFNLGNIKAIGQIRKIAEEGQYDIVHCHTPIAAACTRLACRSLRKKGTKVIYTAHGFHFYNGAPKKNWMIFYPIEKICARWTDVLITINKEDYERAQKKLHARKVEYVPGVGIDVDKFKNAVVDERQKRKEIGVPEDCILLLSVGELNENKNHSTVIRALGQLQDENIYYAIAGEGEFAGKLTTLAEELGIEKKVRLLGYRTDIPALCKASDIFCFPSFREGQGLAALEAMACGLPLITSNVHGINDYSEEGVTGFKVSPHDVCGFSKAILQLAYNDNKEISENNQSRVKEFEISNINKRMHVIYQSRP